MPLPSYINIHTHQFVYQQDVLSILCLLQDDKPVDAQFFSAGIHPWKLHKAFINQQTSWLLRLTQNPNMVALGECGVDMQYPEPDFQVEIFKWQAILAQQLGLPLVIHAVRSHHLILAVRRELGFSSAVPWIIHGFSHRTSIAKLYLDQGFYLSFGHALLRPSNALQDALRYCPDDRLFLETDNSGVNIVDIYQSAAAVKGVGVEAVVGSIQRNFAECFGNKFK